MSRCVFILLSFNSSGVSCPITTALGCLSVLRKVSCYSLGSTCAILLYSSRINLAVEEPLTARVSYVIYISLCKLFIYIQRL
jgi:hypothetical protein